MKPLFYLLPLVLLIYGCTSQKTGTPSAAVASFIDAAKAGDLTELKKYITKFDVSLLEMGENFLAQADPAQASEMKEKMANQFKEKTKNAKINIKDEKIEGDNATVNVAFEHEGKTETRPFSLKKEDGAWRISLISTGMKNSGSGEQDMQEAMKQLNVDSLQNAIKIGMEEYNKIDKDSIKLMMKEAMKEMEALKDTVK